MVRGRQVLRSIAVLAGLGVNSVIGAGRVRRQPGAVHWDNGLGTSTHHTAAGESARMLGQGPSLSPPTSTTVATLTIASTDSAGDGPSAAATSQGPPPSPVGPGELRDTVKAHPGLSTSGGKEHVYPGVYEAGGSSTTEWDASPRTPVPTRPTVAPDPSADRGPPPADPEPTSPSPPANPEPTSPSPPANPEPTSPSPPVNPEPTPPRAPPPIDPGPGMAVPSDAGGSAHTGGPGKAASAPTTQTSAASQATTSPLRDGPPAVGLSEMASVPTVPAATESVDLAQQSTPSGTRDNLSQTTLLTSTRYATGSTADGPSAPVRYCRPSEVTNHGTYWSVVYTSTMTWYGDPGDYKQPYPPISVPATPSCITPLYPLRMTISVCNPTTADTKPTGGDTKPTRADTKPTRGDTKYMVCNAQTLPNSVGLALATPVPIVFLTTDKNPAVVFPTIQTPNYGVSEPPKTRDNHATPTGSAGISTPVYNSRDAGQAVSDIVHSPAPNGITVAVQPTAVVIEGNTIKDSPTHDSQVVIVVGQTFTINHTLVVGAGATIDRPSATGGVYVSVPTSTNLGGVSVVVSATVAVIGGTPFALGSSPITANVSGQIFTVGPSTVAVASETLVLPAIPAPTEVVIAGGDLVTAIGSSILVINSTTLTYGTDSSPTTLFLGPDQVLTLGPGGITANDGALTVGGTHAASPQDTQYALVGGATVTKVGASVVVIANVSYTLGPGGNNNTGTTTTVVGGAQVTVAPTGVQVGGLSWAYPFGVTTIITPGVGAGGGGGGGDGSSTTGLPASTTAGPGGDGGGNGAGLGGDGKKKDAAAGVRPWWVGVVVGAGVAVGLGLGIGLLV